LAFVGYFANLFISKFSFRKSLIISQVFGVLSLLLSYIGFKVSMFSFSLIGIILTGIPSVLLVIVSTSVFQLATESESEFRNLQARMGIISGGTFLISGFVTPIAFKVWGLTIVYFLDFGTYILMIFYLISHHSTWLDDVAQLSSPTHNNLRITFSDIFQIKLLSTNHVRFFALGFSSYLLIGLMPFVASSEKTIWTSEPALGRIDLGFLWGLEALSIIISGVFYVAICSNKKYLFALDFPFPPAFFLIPAFVYRTEPLVFIPALFFVSLFSEILFAKQRDDFLVNSKGTISAVTASSFANIVEKIMMTISPIFLALLIRPSRYIQIYILAIVMFQAFILFAIYIKGHLGISNEK
jgi:hypothetical protein